MTVLPYRGLSVARSRVAARARLAADGAAALILVVGTLLVWSSTSSNDVLTHGHDTAYLHKHLVNITIGLVLVVVVMATDHRWVRIVTPLVYVASVIGLLLVLVMGSTINGSRSWLVLGGLSVQPAEFAKLAVVIGMAMIMAERVENSRQRRVGAVDVALMGDRRHPGAADHAAARPRHDAGARRDRLRRAGGRGMPRRWLVALFAAGAAVATLAVMRAC